MKTLKLLSTLFLSLVAATLSFAQTSGTFAGGAITVPAGAPGTTSGNGDPYPSSVTVSNLSGTITNVTVTISGIGHTWVDDVDIILVSPTGQAVTLMSDVGGSTDITGVNLTFADGSPALPDGTVLTTGTYSPTDINDGADTYPAPGPGAISPPALLSTFNGFAPNGTWSLYVVDDAAGDHGTISSWSLTVTSACSITIPGGAVNEGEACGALTNEGCRNSTAAGTIACGQTVTGTQYQNSFSDYDADEFEFTVTSATNANIAVEAEFDFWFTILDGSCNAVLAGQNGAGCTLANYTQALTPGTYRLHIEPNINVPVVACASEYYITLNLDPVTPVITAGGATTFCEPGSVTLTSTQGTSYLWSPGGATTQSISATTSGSYTVTTTINGCAATTSAPTVVTVNATTPVTFSGLNATYCDDDLGYYDLVPSLYGGAFSGSGVADNGNPFTVTLAPPSLTIADNVPAGTNYAFNVSGLPTSTLGFDYFLGSVCFKATHTWVGDLRATLTSPNGTTVVLFDRPGYTGTGAGCSGNDIDVTFIPGTGTEMETVCNPAVPTISGTFNAFNGANLNSLNDGSDPNGTWTLNISDNAGADVGSVTSVVLNFGGNGVYDAYLNPGTHTVTYDYQNCAGCFSSSSQSTTVNTTPATPTVTVGGPTEFCQGGSVLLTSSSATGNVWAPGGATTQAVSATTTGTYSVTVTENGCSATSIQTTVIANTVPAAAYTGLAGPYCVSNSAAVALVPTAKGGTFSGPGITGNGGAGSAALSGTPVSIPDNNVSGVNSTVTPSGIAGTALGTDQFLTSVCLDITHTFVGDLKATLTSPNNTTVVLFDRPGYTGVGFGCSGNDIDVTIVPGTGTEMETVCNAAAPAIVGEFNAFNGANLNALNDGSNPNGTWTLNVSDNVGADVGTITGFSLKFGGNGEFKASVAGVGTHTITYTNTSCEGCAGTSTQTVVVNALPTATISGTASFCTGGSTTLTSSSATGNVWSPGGATTQSISVSTATDYTVTITDGNNCSATSAATTVTENPLPATPTVTPNGPTTFCDPGSVDLTSSSATGNVWSPGGATTQTITVDADGSYSVTVTDGNGCSATSTTTVVDEEICIGVNESALVNSLNIFPNPAADILNIEFTTEEVNYLEVRVLNTMGQLVYQDIENMFSGTYKNSFSVTGFAAGNYMLQVVTDKTVVNQKVIIK